MELGSGRNLSPNSPELKMTMTAIRRARGALAWVLRGGGARKLRSHRRGGRGRLGAGGGGGGGLGVVWGGGGGGGRRSRRRGTQRTPRLGRWSTMATRGRDGGDEALGPEVDDDKGE